MRINVTASHRFSQRALRLAGAAALCSLLTPLSGCTNRQMDGASPSYLIIDSLLASSGAEPETLSGTLSSDVVSNTGAVWADFGEVTLRTALKDPGSQGTPNVPTQTNWITVTRYHVKFIRADGRNVQGVDVPYEFDGGVTVTALPAGSEANFTLVRVQSKLEAPLRALGDGLGDISTIAEITFYGTDQAGRAVSVTGNISVNFANWADPS